MTDKKHTDLNQDILHKAFEKINLEDNLQPSAELDALVLKQASEQLTERTAQGASSESTSNISDLSFRRNLARERQERLQKKSIFPKWAMPVGLAATVLVSFGVVNRVMQSPDFLQSTGTVQSTAVFDDTSVVNDEAEEQKGEYKIDAVKKANEQVGRQSRVDSNEIPPVTAIEPPASASVVSSSADSVIVTAQRSNSPTPESRTESGNYDPAVQVSSGSIGITLEEETSDSLESGDADAPVTARTEIADEQQKLAAAQTRAKRSRLGISSPAKPEPSVAADQVAEAQEPLSTEIDNVSAISDEADQAYSNMQDETESGFSDAANEGEQFAPAVLESRVKQADEDVVVTAARQESAPPVEADGMGTSNEMEFRENSDLLSVIIFEHRECKVSYDCALVALDCNRCDCIESVNLTNLGKYDSRYNQDEIHNQCSNQVAACELGFCQAIEAETYLQ